MSLFLSSPSFFLSLVISKSPQCPLKNCTTNHPVCFFSLVLQHALCSQIFLFIFVPPFLFCSSFQLHCLLSGVFIGAGGAGATLPLSSHGDRVGWLGQPLCKRPSRPQGMAPLSTLHHGGRWGVGCVRVWTSEERDRGKT